MVMEATRLDATNPAYGARWVTVTDAAAAVGVSTATVRQWYRTGAVATQRRDGDHGPFLVPLDDVRRLADGADAEGSVYRDTVLDINAEYWSAETAIAREAADVACDEAARTRLLLADARAVIEDLDARIVALREQLEAATLRTQRLNDEVEVLSDALANAHKATEDARRLARFASVTSHDWLEHSGPGYRGAARAQATFGDDEVINLTGDDLFGAPEDESKTGPAGR